VDGENKTMIGYKDITFCPFYKDCLTGMDCFRALTPMIKIAASEWWGSDDAPISVFVDKPACFKQKVK